jgi:hypothetical protein
MDPGVTHMRRHPFKRLTATVFQKLFFPGGIVLQNSATKLKTLSPLGPPPGGVLARDGKNRNFLAGAFKQRVYLGLKILRRDAFVNF